MNIRQIQFCTPILLLLAGLLTFVNGCSFLKPAAVETHYYLLAGEPLSKPVVSRTKPQSRAVRIFPVEVPGYLNTSDMVIRIGTNEIVFAKFHQWAEPLGTGIRRVLVQNLQASREIGEVLTDQPSPAGVNVYNISVRILSCEADDINGRGFVNFNAAWEISQEGETKVTRGVFKSRRLPWYPGDYAALASQLSSAVAELGRNLDHAISEQSDGQVIAP